MKRRFGVPGTLVAMLVILAAVEACAPSPDALGGSSSGSTDVPASAPRTSPGSTPTPKLEVVSFDSSFDAGSRHAIPLRVWSPTTGGPYPVIVMSHGGGGSGKGYEYLVKAWAEHGYVVALPTHDDSIAAMKAEGKNRRDALGVVKAHANDPAAWAQRAAEIRAVIDQLPALSQTTPELVGKIDSTKVGVAGHWFGAYTAMLVGGVEPEINGTPTSFRDDRPAGFVLMSPQGVGQQGLTAASYGFLDRPTLVMTGTLDEGRVSDSSGQAQSYQQKLDPYRLAPPEAKTSVVIDGANHFTFSGPGSAGALSAFLDNANDSPAATYDAVVWATLRFWDQVLKGSGAGLSTRDARDAPAKVDIETR